MEEIDLRQYVRQVIEEDLKNVGTKHEKTVAGSVALKKMHDAPGVLEALSNIKSVQELAQVIEAIIDAVPVVSRVEVLNVLTKVTRHEKAARLR